MNQTIILEVLLQDLGTVMVEYAVPNVDHRLLCYQ